MDAKARKALIDGLDDGKNFDASYNATNRRWMIGKLIDVYTARGESDANIKTKTPLVVQRAKAIAAAHRDFGIGLKIADRKEVATERTRRSRRVEALYGLIAHDPELSDPAHKEQLLFSARRRYRVIERFEFYVNPNSRGYFRYRRTCPTKPTWRINQDANTHWFVGVPADLIPIELKKPPDPPDILTALDKIFVSRKKPCEGNLFDCAIMLSILYMDSLREAKDAKKLLESMYARGSTYLCIDHTNSGPLFTQDKTATSLYVRADFHVADMQIGDHVYIHNHGLYKRLDPEGSWRGEHAVLTDCGDRQLQSDNGYRFMGHGMPSGGETGSIPRFYSGLVNELNTHLHRCFRIGGIFLFYMRSNRTEFPTKVTRETVTITDPGGTARSVDFYFFDLGFKYPNYQKKPPRGGKLGENSEHGFVIWHIASLRTFGIHFKKTIADAKTEGVFGGGKSVRFDRVAVPADATNLADVFDAPAWTLPFPDANDVERQYKVFEKQGAALAINLLETADLYVQPLARIDPTVPTGVETTRSRVDTSSTYTTFLTSKGAI